MYNYLFTHTHTRAFIHIFTHTNTHSHSHIHTHSNTHANTDTHTHKIVRKTNTLIFLIMMFYTQECLYKWYKHVERINRNKKK